MIRLKKPLTHYAKKYQDPSWGTKKLLDLMRCQQNRGEDGAGVAVIQLNDSKKTSTIHHYRSCESDPIVSITNHILGEKSSPSSFLGEILLGHLRYATYSGLDVALCQPFVVNTLKNKKNLIVAGNFNVTNIRELLETVKQQNIQDNFHSDTRILADLLAFHINQETDPLLHAIEKTINDWDGGFVLFGALESGDIFVFRDAAGIRSAFFYEDDEILAFASERSALARTFGLHIDQIKPVKPGEVMVIKKDGTFTTSISKKVPKKECMFERIYLSNQEDPEIYLERKELGRLLAPRVFDLIDKDLKNVIFTYVPASSLLAFQGLVDEISILSRRHCLNQLCSSQNFNALNTVTQIQARTEHLLRKNKRTRSFILNDQIRSSIVKHLYSETRGIINDQTTLVVVDDSIVRGTTMKNAILAKLIQLNPKKIIIVSSAPLILYPDCYGIDMSKIGSLIAFQAAEALLKEHNKKSILDEVKELITQEQSLDHINHVKRIYELFTSDQLEDKISEIFLTDQTEWNGSLHCIFQSLEDLHKAIPNHKGDWYFSGNYPTPGGFKVVNRSFIHWMNGMSCRSY